MLAQALAAALVLVAPMAGPEQIPGATGRSHAECDVFKSDAGFVPCMEMPASADGGVALVPPELLQNSPAEYPPGAGGERPSGVVELELLVDETGRVASANVHKGVGPELDARAQAAAMGLRFTPARVGDRPVAVRLRYSYEFIPPTLASATVRGQVRTRGTRKPISGAVFLEGGAEFGATDPEGRFELRLQPGRHQLEVRVPGHATATFTESVGPGQLVEVLYRLEPLAGEPYETVIHGERERMETTRVSLAAQELQEVPGTMGDPFRVVMLLPGVSNIASGVSYPVVRGAQPAATGYFIDGVRVPGLFHLFLGPAVVHPDFLERLDFYPGIPPPEYGRLLGGVVDAQVSRPPEDRLHASAYADLINAGAFLEHPFEQTGTHVTLSGRFSYMPWLIAALARAPQATDSEGYSTRLVGDFYDYQARVEQRVSEGKLQLLALGSSDLVGFDSQNPAGVDAFTYSRFHKADLRFQRSLDLGALEVGATVGTERVGVIGGSTNEASTDYALASTTYEGRVSWSMTADALRLAAGADVEHRRAETSLLFDVATPNGMPRDEDWAFRPPTALATFAGVFGSTTWTPTPHWTVSAGLRLDNYHLLQGINHLALEPRLSVHRVITPQVLVKFGAGIFHQAPTTLITLPLLDVAGLRYGLQEAVQGDLGLEWTPLPNLELKLDAYYSELTRAIEFDLVGVLQEQRRRGVLGVDVVRRGRSFGLDLMIRKRLGGKWFGWVSYSLQRSTRRQRFARFDDNLEVVEWVEKDLPFAFDQTHVLNAALSYKLPRDWTLGTVVHFNTGRPESGEISSRTQREMLDPATGDSTWRTINRDEVERLPSFFRIDVRVSKRLRFDDFEAEAYLDVFNSLLSQEILGYRYAQFPSGLVREPISLPAIIPMLGIKGAY